MSGTVQAEETRRPDDLIGVYLQEISDIPLLTAADEVRLGRTIERGILARETLESGAPPHRIAELRESAASGERAQRTLVRANLRLVVSMAKRYSGRGMSLLDLVQEGNLGLMRAARTFDYRRGCKFSTYATWLIRQAISRAIGEKARAIRIPSHIADAVQQARKAQRRLQQRLERPPTYAEVAAELDVTEERARDLLQWAADLISLDRVVGDGELLLADLVRDDTAERAFEGITDSFLPRDVGAALDCLSERERSILSMRYGLGGTGPRTLQGVSAAFGITRERVRQIERRALRRLRQHPRVRPLVDYLR